ncbi:MAG: hypothetical protein ACRBHB_14020 [Arenicella sp.]
MKLAKYILFLIPVLLLTGCATVQNSAFDNGTKTLDFSQNSYFIMGVDIRNSVKPNYNPNNAMILHIEKPDAKDKKDRFNVLLNPKEFLGFQGSGASGYFRGALPPGDYILKGISGSAQRKLILGHFLLPMHSAFTLGKNEVVYLGKLKAKTRKKREGEFSAGSIIPLIDQAVSGFASSTFDVLISDETDVSGQNIAHVYPVLAPEDITIKILAEYDRSQFDAKGVKPQANPTFQDEVISEQEAISTVGPVESAFPHIVAGLNSPETAEFQRAAALVNKKKLYTDSGVFNMMVARTQRAVVDPSSASDDNIIDGLAYCVLNIGKSNDSRSVPLLNEVIKSSLHRKVKSHARHALKLKNKP